MDKHTPNTCSTGTDTPSRAAHTPSPTLASHPAVSFSLTEIAGELGLSASTVMREIDRLAAAGLLLESRIGNQRRVRANTDNALYAPLAHLMAVTFGPIPILKGLLDDLEGVREAYIYGSWAARYDQEPGAVPHDLDVLVIGTADADDLDDVARAASDRLGREVTIRRVRPAAWDSATDDPFKTTVLSRPLVTLTGPASDE